MQEFHACESSSDGRAPDVVAWRSRRLSSLAWLVTMTDVERRECRLLAHVAYTRPRKEISGASPRTADVT